MNLYKLHNKPEELDNYDKIDVLRNQSNKIDADPGTQYHNVFGELNREDGPAYILPGRVKTWYKHGLRHREDGPARSLRHRKEYWVDGKQHRLDGPAVINSNGENEYWIDGHRYDTIVDYEIAGGNPL